MTPDILNNLPWFFAGMCLCAGLALLLDAKHLVPSIAARVRIQRRVSLVELLDAMAKAQIVSRAVEYEDDAGPLDPEVAKYFKKVLTNGNEAGN